MNLFNEKKMISSSDYQEFTEGLPFVVAAVVAILAVPGDKKQDQDQQKPQEESRIVSIQERTESSVNANTYVYEAIKK